VKIFLDDIREPPDDSWTVCRSAQQARELILDCDHRIEGMSFDHDLGDDEDGTGYDVVLWMAELNEIGFRNIWPLKKPTIHSANPVGRDRMAGVIDRYGPYE
jgi:hypothetical protein